MQQPITMKYYDTTSEFDIDSHFEQLVNREIDSYIEHKRDLGHGSSYELEHMPFEERQQSLFDKIVAGNIFAILMLDGEGKGYRKGKILPHGRKDYNSKEFESIYTYVPPEHRRQGYGHMLKNDQILYATKHGCARVLSSTTVDGFNNIVAQKILKATGHQTVIYNGIMHGHIDL